MFRRNVAPRQPAHISGGTDKVQPTIITQGFTLEQLLEAMRPMIRHEVGQVKTEAPSAPAVEEELLTVRQAATLLDVCVATLHQWKRLGLLPYTRLGGRVYLKKGDVLSAGTRCRRSVK